MVGSISNLDGDRPLKYPLRSGDLLLLLHIPKTAGTSLYQLLCDRFPRDEIAPFTEPDMIKQIISTPRQRIEQLRLMRTHFDYSIYKFLPRKPVYITMLRDPIERTMSLYKHIQRVNTHDLHQQFVEQDITISQMLDLPLAKRRFNNRQTNQLAGATHGDAKQLSDRARLEVAKVHLDEFAYFGLTERFNDSINLLVYTFDFKPFKRLPRLNTARTHTSGTDLSEEDLKAIKEHNQQDIELYAHAMALFDERFQKMNDPQSRRQTLHHRTPSLTERIRQRLLPSGSHSERIFKSIYNVVRSK